MSVVRSTWRSFDDYIHGGQPVIRQWFLLGNISSVFIISTLYVLFVKVIGPAYMKNRKPYNLRNIMPPYNFALVIFYIYFILKGLSYAPELGWKCFCGSLTTVPGIEKYYGLVWQLYLAKYAELLDTIFLVLSKKFKMITILHVAHHAIVPIFGFIGIRSETTAYLSVFMMINSFIHVIMYTYYGIAALGPTYQKYLWWKKYLTVLQIAQFLVMSIYISIMSYLGCASSKFTTYFTMVITVGLLFLFMNYYKKVFVDGERKVQSTKHSPKLLNNSISNRLNNCQTKNSVAEKKQE